MAAAQVKCPTCGRRIEWSDAFPFKPFCSERCKMIDLGAWLSEKRGIPAEAQEPDTGTSNDSPPEPES